MKRRVSVPETMRAAAIDRFGGPEVIKIHTIPVPAPSSGEVLIAVDTAGVGVWDLKIREGVWAEHDRFPKILGTDGSGTIAQSGSRARRFRVGDRVYSYSYENPKGGFYAEYVAVSAAKVGNVPTKLDLERAGAVPTTGLTALQGIDDVLKIRTGETLIVHGASGGVGCLAVQFAKWRGARVFATASGSRGASFVRRLGADRAIDGKREDIVKAGREFAPDGFDAILALIGGKQLDLCLAMVRRGGRVAYPNGVEPAPRRRGLSIQAYDAAAGPRQFQRLGRAIEESKLEIPIARVFGLQDAAKAHRFMARGGILGKIVLKVARSGRRRARSR